MGGDKIAVKKTGNKGKSSKMGKELVSARAERLERLFKVLTKVNDAIVIHKEPVPFFKEICRILVEDGGYKMAWMGPFDEKTGTVTAKAHYGVESDFMRHLHFSIDPSVPEGKGPGGHALRERKPIVINDISNSPYVLRLKQEALDRHYLSSVCFPLLSEESVLGALLILSDKKNFFNDSELELLNSIISNLSIAITKRMLRKRERETSRTLDAEREQLLKLFDSLNEIIYVTDFNTRELLWANSHLKSILGSNPIGKMCFKEINGYTAPCDFCTNSVIVKNPDKTYQFEHCNKKLGGTYTVYGRMIKWMDGREAKLEVMYDITELKKAQDELANYNQNLETVVKERTGALDEANAKLSRMVSETNRVAAELLAANQILESWFDSTHLLIAYLDRDFNFIRVNQAYANSGGHPQEFYPGQNHFDLYPDAENEKIFRHVVETGESHFEYAKGFQYEEYPERGLTYWDWSVHAIKDDAGGVEGVIFVLLDVTRRVEAEMTLDRQRVVAINTDRLRSLGETAAGMAHELYQPLAGMRALAEQILIGMKRGWEYSHEDLTSNLTLMLEQADRMSHIMEHVRQFARGANPADRFPVQVNEVINASMIIIKSQLKYRGLNLKRELAEGLPPVWANGFSLEEVILNLVSNASDALEDKMRTRPDVSNEIVIRTRSEGMNGNESVIIEVSDSGSGIPDKIKGRIFDAFFTTKSPERGTGLGLAICKSIIDEFNGSISVQSSVGEGATVTVKLPCMREGDGGYDVGR